MTHQILKLIAKIDGFSRITRYNVNLKIQFYIHHISPIPFVKTITKYIVESQLETQNVLRAPK